MKFNAKNYKTNEILKMIRQGLELTQERMAKDLKISKSSIEKYEYGTTNYNFELLQKIARTYDLDITIERK